MAGGLSTDGANALGALAFGAVSFPQPSIYAQPNEVQPAEDGTGADVPDSGFSSRVALAFATASSRSVAMASPTALYTSSGVEDLDSVALFDASSGGNLLALASLSAVHTSANGLQVKCTTLSISLDSGPCQDALATPLLEHLGGGTAYTPETTHQFGFISSGTTELSGNAYARLTGVANNTTTWDTWVDGETTNLIDLVWSTPASGNWTTATRLGIWNGAGTTLLWIAELTAPVAVLSGNTVKIPAGALKLRFIADFGPSVAEPITGAWYDVTPVGLDLSDEINGNDSYGVQDIVVDPARPQDAYAFTCYQGVWKSTDYGKTWTKHNTTTTSLDDGKLWSAAIDPNASRDPGTPPRMWTLNGVSATSSQGVWRSDDGGVTWAYKASGGPSNDVYTIVVNPYDSDHLLISYHDAAPIYESFDGGDTWAIGGVSPAADVSAYVFFVDTGNPVTTALTWLVVPQADSSGAGIRRTTDGGATWTTVLTGGKHAHGLCQIAQLGGGTIVFANYGTGIYESTDYGATWSLITSAETTITAACADDDWVWVWNSYPAHFSIGHNMRRRARSGGSYTALSGVDAGMTNGGKNMAVTTKGGRTVLLTGNWQAGIWRWVEP